MINNNTLTKEKNEMSVTCNYYFTDDSINTASSPVPPIKYTTNDTLPDTVEEFINMKEMFNLKSLMTHGIFYLFSLKRKTCGSVINYFLRKLN